MGDRSRGRFATPADFPLHDGTPCSHVHVRRERLVFVHRSRTIFCQRLPSDSRTFASLYAGSVRTAYTWSLLGAKPGGKPTNRQSDCCSLAFPLPAGDGGLGSPCADAVVLSGVEVEVRLGGGGVTCTHVAGVEIRADGKQLCCRF